MVKYSVIIPTYNRIDELRELVDSMIKLDFDMSAVELVIVDDGSTDGTKEWLDSLTLPFSLQYFLQKNQGPGPARNQGMTMARGAYFLFVDSDCLLPQDYLGQIDTHLTTNNLDAFGGPDTYHPSFSPLLKAINYSMTSFIGTGGTRGAKKAVAKYYPRSFNMGIKREVYEKIGGFGTLRHGQDMDFSARIYGADFKVGFISEAYVYHKRRTSLKRFFKQIFNWGVARINLAKMHEGFLKPIHLAPAFLVLCSTVCMIISIITLSPLWLIPIAMGTFVFGSIAFAQSLATYKSLQVALLSIITLLTQVLAYGLGSLSGIWQHLLGNKESKGFTRNYYK